MDVLIVNRIREVAQDIESQICELMGPTTIRHASSVAAAFAALSQREPVQSGMSVSSALQRVGMEIKVAHSLLAYELELVQRDVTLGAPMDGALSNVASCSGVDVLRELATFMRESLQFGSEIVDALRVQADTMRFQREQTAEENAQKATVKIFFPMLLLILPAIFVVLVGPAVIQIQMAFSR